MKQRLDHPLAILAIGSLILTIGLGVRHAFGLFLKPMSLDLSWGRETFAFAVAVQNLLWGAAQPFAGMIADRHGPVRVVAGGAALYALGLALMAQASTGLGLTLSAGVLVGLGLSGVSFSVIYGAVARAFPPERRSLALGVAGAAGSFGQFAVLPVAQWGIDSAGWVASVYVLAFTVALLAPFAAALGGGASAAAPRQSLSEALAEARDHRGFWLLCAGFFVCGFQVVFIGVHFPAYMQDRGLPAHVGATALALIGLFNILGSYAAGHLGGIYRKKHLLAGIYLLRSVAIAIFLALPPSPLTVYAFASAIGLLWLGTVPLTSGLVGQIFGVAYLSTLFGIVFFAHQVGSFLGVWLGGWSYDALGSYDPIWWASIALGVAAAALHWPIDDRALERPAAQPAPA